MNEHYHVACITGGNGYYELVVTQCDNGTWKVEDEIGVILIKDISKKQAITNAVKFLYATHGKYKGFKIVYGAGCPDNKTLDQAIEEVN